MTMPLLTVLASAALVAAATSMAGEEVKPAPASTAEIKTLACDVPFGKDATEESLKQAFGGDNVVYKSVPGAEGTESNASVIFPNDPARMVTVFWWDEEKRARPSTVQVQANWESAGDGEDADPWKTDVLWQTPQGIRIGSTIEEVEAANGKPFEIAGFGWDYGGFAVNWNGGALQTPEGVCGFSIRFSPSAPTPEGATGDTQLPSNNPDMRASKARVTEISVGYPIEN